MTVRVVRRIGMNATHVADLPDGLIRIARTFGRDFVGASTPVAVACGATLRDTFGVVSCMNPGTKVSCRACRRATGVEVAAEGNSSLPAVEGGDTP